MNSNMPRADWPIEPCLTSSEKSEIRIQNSKFETRSSKLRQRISIFDFRSSIRGFQLMLIITICLFALPGYGVGFKKKGQPTKDYLAEYIERVKAVKASTPSTGSFWTPQSPYSDLASDYKARNVNDLIVIQVVESTTAAEDGAVKSARTFSASSGISGLMGTPGPTSWFAKHLLTEFLTDSEWAGASVLRFHPDYQPLRPGCRRFAQRISGD